MDNCQNVTTGAKEFENGVILDAYSNEKDHGSDKIYDFDGSGNSSMITEPGGFNERADRPKQPDQPQNVAEPVFQPESHPYTKRSLDSAAIQKLWQKIEIGRASYDSDPFALIQVLSALQVLRHASISKQALQATDIIARLRDLQNFKDCYIAKNVSEVVVRLQKILFQQTPTDELVQSRPAGQKILPTYLPPNDILQATPNILKSHPAVNQPGGLFADFSDQKIVKPRKPFIPPSIKQDMKGEQCGHHSLRAESNATLFKFNTPFNERNSQPLRGGASGQDKIKVSIDPSTSTGSEELQCLLSNPFGQTQAPNKSAWPTTNPPANSSPFQFGENKKGQMASVEEFITWVKIFLDLDQPDMISVTFHLRSAWDSIVSFKDSLRRTGQSITEGKNSIRNMESEIAQLQMQHGDDALENARRNLLTQCRDSLFLARTSVIEQEKTAQALRADLIKAVCVPLEKLFGVGKSRRDDYDKKMWEVNAKLLRFTDTLKKTHDDLTAAKNQIALLESEKDEAESQALDGYLEIDELSNTIDCLQNDLENKDAEYVQEKQALSEEYRAKAEQDAQAKSSEHAKFVGKIEGLEAKIEGLEREKMDITIAKAIVEKERKDFEAEANSLKGYKDGYLQLVRELDELQGTCNDAVAERDDLIKQMQDAEAFAKNGSRHHELAAAQPSLAFQRPFAIAHVTNSEHLDGVIAHWKNQLSIKMASTDKAQTHIASLEADIRDAHTLLYPAQKQKAPHSGITVNTSIMPRNPTCRCVSTAFD